MIDSRPSLNTAEAKKVLEAALLCAGQPVSADDLLDLFETGMTPTKLEIVLAELQEDWQDRGLELVKVASGWRFQSRQLLMPYLGRMQPERPPRYSRAAMEVLAVIAYRQPVTRGDIEEIRGVAVNSQIIRQFEDRGWIEVVGHKETVGRPALFATTSQFLNDLGLEALTALPIIENLTINELPANLSEEQAQALAQLAALQNHEAPAPQTITDQTPSAAEETGQTP